MKTVVRIEGLSKAYRIGAVKQKADTMVGAVWEGLLSPWRNFINLKGLRNLTHSDETVFWALKDVSFEVAEGEVIGIIGHNGAGKSTLLKILSRITEPTSGRVVIEGRVSSLLEVGTGFHPDLTGRENIYMNGTILGMRKKEIDAKLEEIVEFSGVSRHIDTPVKRYSTGMTVRLAFSVAAHLEPEILIIDEVLSVGDAEFQKKCLGRMQNVANAGRTILFVSHNIEALKAICSRAVLLDHGVKVLEGGVTETVNQYLSKFNVDVLRVDFPAENAPGSEGLRLISASVTAQDNIYSVNSEVRVSFEVLALHSMEQINLSVVLSTITGICVFNIGTSLYDLETSQAYISELVIPQNFLNDETYKVDIYAIQYTSRVIFKVESALIFDVKDTSREGNWYGKWIGVVRPRLVFNLRSK